VTAEPKHSHLVPFAELARNLRAGLEAGQLADPAEPLSSADQRVLASPVTKPESAAIGALLTKSTLRRPSSVESGVEELCG
jgi:hypothetical protein